MNLANAVARALSRRLYARRKPTITRFTISSPFSGSLVFTLTLSLALSLSLALAPLTAALDPALTLALSPHPHSIIAPQS